MKTARYKLDQIIKSIHDATFCHHKGCRRKYNYLNKNGYVMVKGIIYCMDHQPKIKHDHPKRPG